MPSVRKTNETVIAIAVADIHLQHVAPICRAEEPDWYAAMARPLEALRDLQEKHNCPILCAGDVFDNWNSRPELVNFAIAHLPEMWAVPGQHDLPAHNLDHVEKSAYWTLVMAGVIKPLAEWQIDGGMVYGFPWGVEITPPKENGGINICVAHKYVWIKGHSFTGAPEDRRVNAVKGLTNFDVCVFGDNHSGFLTRIGTRTNVFNCGTFMRRRSDEADYLPQVGLIYSDGSVVPHLLDISRDILDSTKVEPSVDQARLDAQEFLAQLNGLSETSLDFRAAIMQQISAGGVRPAVCKVLTKILEGS